MREEPNTTNFLAPRSYSVCHGWVPTRRYGAEVTHAILPGEARVTIILL
ncbi:unnamed protein product [Spirodela intermedia]|uniref:Uncharacterized protein n=1 Tax=Spirodela intermedia TaxID=51605 RepID=A0ABN7EDJ6_SPIIN|nr:unnamed protein product [Spirodela intermedia]